MIELRRARVSSGTHGQWWRPGETGFAGGGVVTAPTAAPVAAVASQRPPTWAEITAAPKFKALDAAGRESARHSYWRYTVAPEIDTDDLPAALTRFEQLTGGHAPGGSQSTTHGRRDRARCTLTLRRARTPASTATPKANTGGGR